jgi:hypothetical protein
MTIPSFPVTRQLTLADRELFTELFHDLKPLASEFTFAGLYLFRTAHRYRLGMVGDSVVVLGSGYDGVDYALPPLGGNVAAALRWLLEGGIGIYGADERFVSLYCGGESVDIVEDRDNWDYLYLRHELAELPGNRFHKKKNRVNYFRARHDCRVELLGPGHGDGCLALLDEWGRVRGGGGNRSLLPELAANAEAIRLQGELGLQGVVAIVDGAVKAFALGEKLNDTTSVCHFEKADPFMEGLSQLIDQEFNRRLFTECEFVNREQDLGESGLRNAKLSYQPVEMVKKYRLRARLS